MKFTEYIKSLPNQRNEVIMDLTKLCRVNESTVYRWLRGDFVPDALKRKVISEYLNIPAKELWPNVYRLPKLRVPSQLYQWVVLP